VTGLKCSGQSSRTLTRSDRPLPSTTTSVENPSPGLGMTNSRNCMPATTGRPSASNVNGATPPRSLTVSGPSASARRAPSGGNVSCGAPAASSNTAPRGRNRRSGSGNSAAPRISVAGGVQGDCWGSCQPDQARLSGKTVRHRVNSASRRGTVVDCAGQPASIQASMSANRQRTARPMRIGAGIAPFE